MHARVVAGAHAAVAEYGWAGATLARIAEEAGVSRMTLHRHRLGREEIFQLLARAYEDDFQMSLAAALRNRERPCQELRDRRLFRDRTGPRDR